MIHWENLTPTEKERILKAVDRLVANNPNVVRQIEKLADVKENEPKKWNLGLKVLKIS